MVRTLRCRTSSAPATLALCTLALVGCTIEDPQLPTYEAEWIIPLGTIDENLGSLIEDEEDFVIGEDGSITLSTAGELDAIGVGDRLDVDVEGMDFGAEIGTIHLDSTEPVGFAHRLGRLYPAADAMHGADVPVPSFQFSLDSDPQDLPGFRSATVASGGLEIEVANGLPVPIGGDSYPEQLIIGLVDPVDQSHLGYFVVPEAIPAGSSYHRWIELGGAVLPDSVGVVLSGGSPGSGGQLVRIDAQSELAVSVRTSDLEVTSAEASVGEQSFLEVASVDLPDSVRVLRATVSQGELVMRLSNELPLDTTVDLEIPGFVDDDGAALVLSIPLPAGSNVDRSVDLRPYELRLGTEPGQKLDLFARVSTPGSDGAYVQIRSTDRIAVVVEPLSLRFSSVTGILDPVEVDIESSQTTIEIPEDLEHMQLQSAELVLGFRSTLGMPVNVDLRMEGTNDRGVMVPLETSIEIPALLPDQPTQHARTLDRTNSSIVEFLNNLPTAITFSGTARIGDGFTVGTVATTDSVSARWSISAPMVVAVAAQTIDSDADSIDLGEELRDHLRERLVELTLEAEVTSTLPLAATAFVGIDSDAQAVFDAPALRLGPIAIPAATTAGNGTRVPATLTSTLVIAREDVPLITEPGSWQGLRLTIPGTDGRFVTLRASDAVQVRGFLRARVLVGEVR